MPFWRRIITVSLLTSSLSIKRHSWLLRDTRNKIWSDRWDRLPHDPAESGDWWRFSTFRWYGLSDRASGDNKREFGEPISKTILLWFVAFISVSTYTKRLLVTSLNMDILFSGHSYVLRLQDHYLPRPDHHRSFTRVCRHARPDRRDVRPFQSRRAATLCRNINLDENLNAAYMVADDIVFVSDLPRSRHDVRAVGPAMVVVDIGSNDIARLTTVDQGWGQVFSEVLESSTSTFQTCKYKYKYKYWEYLNSIKYIKYFFSQVQVQVPSTLVTNNTTISLDLDLICHHYLGTCSFM